MLHKRKRKMPLREKMEATSGLEREEERKGKTKEKKKEGKLEGMEGDWKRRRKPFSAIFFHHCGCREAD